MANLTRYKQKIFANNSNQVGVFGTGVNKQTSKNVETLQSSDYEGGWSEAIVTNKNYPIWQERDGVDYGFSYQLAYLLQKGLPEWLSTETYYTNDYCRVGSTIYYSLQDNNTNHNPTANNGYWAALLTSNRSIGQIVPSTIALTEAGLHLLDGTLIQGTGIYAQFVTYMANLTTTQPDVFCTEADWQQSVTNYGACGKFVYNSVNNTIRLPKMVGITEGTNDTTTLGDLTEAGLPNITGTATGTEFPGGMQSTTGALYNPVPGESNYSSGSTGSGKSRILAFDASLSNSIYGNSSTVQPQSIKVLYYIVVATSTKTDIEVDIDEIATDLNSKADTDLSNISASQSAKNTIVAWGMPDYANAITISSTPWTTTSYTAPSDGLVLFDCGLYNSGGYIQINSTDLMKRTSTGGYTSDYSFVLPINKNDIISFNTGYNNTTLTSGIVYLYISA